MIRKPPLPTAEQFGTAIMWLENYESADEAGEACRAVAEWLEYQEQERTLRLAAREGGVTVARLRRKMATMAD